MTNATETLRPWPPADRLSELEWFYRQHDVGSVLIARDGRSITVLQFFGIPWEPEVHVLRTMRELRNFLGY